MSPCAISWETLRVRSAGWRIREIPDCASSPKIHGNFRICDAGFLQRIEALADDCRPRLVRSGSA